MFNVVEIDKTYLYENSFTPYNPYVYQTVTAISSVASYWTDTFGADGTYNSELVQIESVTIDSIFQVNSVDTLADCLTQENSFYFDYDNQLLYIHVPHSYGTAGRTFEIGRLFGYCSDTVRYFRNQIYQPIVQSIPNISDQADPLQYGIIAFGGGSVTLTNDGTFDTDEKLYGNEVRIKRGAEGDTYDDLILMFTGYVKDYTTTTRDISIEVGDKRERLEVAYPTDVYTILDAYNDNTATWEKDEELEHDGYGDVIQVQAYPTAENTTTVTFKWGISVTSISQVYTYYDEVLSPVTHSSFSTDGTFALDIVDVAKDGADVKKGIKEVYVTGRMRDYDNPADIISDLNSRVADIDYNSSNYNQTEWTSEKASLADISLYMDSTKKLYEWIELMQNGSDPGFRYEDTDKITLRIDDPTRLTSVSIQPVDIRNSDIPVEQNAQLYASSAIVKYSKNHRRGKYNQVTNTAYEDDVIREHRVKKIETYETLLTNSTDATAKASRIMADISQIRPIVTLVVPDSLYPQPRIYDTVSATVSLLTQGARLPEEFVYVLSDLYLLGDSDILGETEAKNIVPRNDIRTYLGQITGIVMGIRYLETDEVEIKVRSV
jgi:hypothetical protein